MRHTTATHTLTIPRGTPLYEPGHATPTTTAPVDFPIVSAIRDGDSYRVVIGGREYRVRAGDVENVRAIDD